MKSVVVFDIDGTLANCDHRRHLVEKFKPDGTKNKHRDYEQFYDLCHLDTVHEGVLETLHAMGRVEYGCVRQFNIIFVTGRPERTRYKTEIWLGNVVGMYTYGIDFDLYMRPDGDTRQDFVVKEEILHTKLVKEDILFCMDDRQQVVDMWRRNGLVCFQVAPGNF